MTNSSMSFLEISNKSTSLVLLLLMWIVSSCQDTNSSTPVEVSIEQSLHTDDFDGRLFLLIANNNEAEPRFQIGDSYDTQQIFGQNVDSWTKGENIRFNESAYGYPINKMDQLPDGDYFLQALFHKYETFERADGKVVKLPMDRGEGQKWNRAPGNLYSTPQKVSIRSGRLPAVSITLDQQIPPIDPPKDSKYIKHIKIKSELLSEFWGRPMYLGAHVLLPEGFDEHPDVKYPLAIMHGHFPSDFGGFRTTPPDTTEPCQYSDRFGVECYNRIVQQEAYNFFRAWTGADFPRVIAIKIQHANPYYDDSYAVNSANLGPYGDAITYELIPYIEKQFRGIGKGWARFLYGGSTGGWEALAAQVFYPEEYNSCYAACPDPIDFRAYCLVNLYEDDNAYYEAGQFRKTLRPGRRDYLGRVSSTLMDMNHRELALGTRGRSGQQWDIWEAVYSPVDTDGYPKRIWDKESGKINREVADYWKENYDLAYILKRDWEKIGPQLEGKINIYCGDMDNYYLNNAVYLMEEMLENTSAPYYNGEIDYGDRAEHCWNGYPNEPNHISRLRYHRFFIPKWTTYITKNPPAGADVTSWRY